MTTIETFSYSSTISSSWKLMRRHWQFMAAAVGITVIIMILMQWLSAITDGRGAASFIVSFISIVVSLALAIGWTNVILQLIRGTSAGWKDFQTAPRIWANYFVARFLAGIGILGGLILVFGPIAGVFVSRSLHMPWYAIILGLISTVLGLILIAWISVQIFFVPMIAVDHPTIGGWQLIKKSRHMAKGKLFDLLGLLILLCLLNIVGLLAVGVGLLVTMPLSKMAKIYTYDHLRGKTH